MFLSSSYTINPLPLGRFQPWIRPNQADSNQRKIQFTDLKPSHYRCQSNTQLCGTLSRIGTISRFLFCWGLRGASLLSRPYLVRTRNRFIPVPTLSLGTRVSHGRPGGKGRCSSTMVRLLPENDFTDTVNGGDVPDAKRSCIPFLIIFISCLMQSRNLDGCPSLDMRRLGAVMMSFEYTGSLKTVPKGLKTSQGRCLLSFGRIEGVYFYRTDNSLIPQLYGCIRVMSQLITGVCKFPTCTVCCGMMKYDYLPSSPCLPEGILGITFVEAFINWRYSCAEHCLIDIKFLPYPSNALRPVLLNSLSHTFKVAVSKCCAQTLSAPIRLCMLFSAFRKSFVPFSNGLVTHAIHTVKLFREPKNLHFIFLH